MIKRESFFFGIERSVYTVVLIHYFDNQDLKYVEKFLIKSATIQLWIEKSILAKVLQNAVYFNHSA